MTFKKMPSKCPVGSGLSIDEYTGHYDYCESGKSMDTCLSMFDEFFYSEGYVYYDSGSFGAFMKLFGNGICSYGDHVRRFKHKCGSAKDAIFVSNAYGHYGFNNMMEDVVKAGLDCLVFNGYYSFRSGCGANDFMIIFGKNEVLDRWRNRDGLIFDTKFVRVHSWAEKMYEYFDKYKYEEFRLNPEPVDLERAHRVSEWYPDEYKVFA